MTLYLDVEPVAAARPRVTRNGTYTPAKYAGWKRTAKILLKQLYSGDPLEGPLKLHVHFFIEKPKSVKREYPCVKPDLDNFLKAVHDAGNEIIWADDAQIVKLSAEKSYGDPHIVITVSKLGDAP